MRQKSFAVIAALTLFVTLVLSIYAVKAQDSPSGGTGFRVSPARYDIDTDPDQTIIRPIEVTNLTNTAQRAIPVVNDFVASDNEDGTPVLIVDSDGTNNPRSIQPFVLPISAFNLEPGESNTVNVTFDIPTDVSPGAYYGVVRFVAEAPNQDEDANISLTASVGTVFLLNVKGDTVSLLTLEETGAISSPGSSIGSFFSSPPQGVAVRISNQGNTFEAPFGSVKIKNWKGDVVYQYEINDTDPRGNVLPESIRRFESSIENVGSFGRYSIEAFISYGDGGSIIEANSTFWVIPWGQILVGASIIAIIAFLGSRGLKAYNRKIVDDSRKNY